MPLSYSCYSQVHGAATGNWAHSIPIQSTSIAIHPTDISFLPHHLFSLHHSPPSARRPLASHLPRRALSHWHSVSIHRYCIIPDIPLLAPPSLLRAPRSSFPSHKTPTPATSCRRPAASGPEASARISKHANLVAARCAPSGCSLLSSSSVRLAAPSVRTEQGRADRSTLRARAPKGVCHYVRIVSAQGVVRRARSASVCMPLGPSRVRALSAGHSGRLTGHAVRAGDF